MTELDFSFIAEGSSTAIARDLRLNLGKIVNEGPLGQNHALLATLALATSVGHGALGEFARARLGERDFMPEQIMEAEESAAVMGMLNVYYRFKHMLGSEEYRAAGLRMTGLAKPVLGKERFEMLAFAVSVLNGCETCIRAHEKVLRDGGLSEDQVHDLARLAAVVKGISVLGGGQL